MSSAARSSKSTSGVRSYAEVMGFQNPSRPRESFQSARTGTSRRRRAGPAPCLAMIDARARSAASKSSRSTSPALACSTSQRRMDASPKRRRSSRVVAERSMLLSRSVPLPPPGSERAMRTEPPRSGTSKAGSWSSTEVETSALERPVGDAERRMLLVARLEHLRGGRVGRTRLERLS